MATDLKFSGQYSLSGTGLGMINLNGHIKFLSVTPPLILTSGGGDLNITVNQLVLTGETFLVLQEDKGGEDVKLIVKNVNIKMNNEALDVELENLLGGGLIGDMANKIVNLIGDSFLQSHKDILSRTVRDKFREKFDQLINIQSRELLNK